MLYLASCQHSKGLAVISKGDPFPQIHAEQCLIANALLHGERGLRKLAVSAAPCGHCRQFYSELCCAVRLRCSQKHVDCSG